MDSASTPILTLADRLRAMSANVDTLRAALAERHDCADGDFGAKWWQLVTDAYEGSGGFRAAVRAASIGDAWGEGSYDSSWWTRGSRKSYLQQFVRESMQEYQRRSASSTYRNLVAPIVDTYHAHLTARPAKRESTIPAVASWWASCDAAGHDVGEWMARGILRAQLFGWCVAVFDRDRGDVPRAQAKTRAAWLDPEAVVDWSISEDGQLDWLRTVSCEESEDPILDEDIERETYTVWTRTEWATVTFECSEGKPPRVAAIDGAVHGLGRVPAAVLRFREHLDADALYGLSQVSDVIPLCLSLFNVESQLTHHLAAAVFAILALQDDGTDRYANLKLGTNNGLVYPQGSAAPQFVAPPDSVSLQLAVRADQLVDAIYQAARIERPKASAQGGDVASGIARSYDFQQTEAVLRGFAQRVTAFEHECAAIVALWDAAPVSDPAAVVTATAAATTIAYPERYDVAGLQDELAAQFAALTKDVRDQLPPTAIAHARTVIALGLNPQATADTERAIRDEVDAMRLRDASASVAADHAAAIAALPPATEGALMAHTPGETPAAPAGP